MTQRSPLMTTVKMKTLTLTLLHLLLLPLLLLLLVLFLVQSMLVMMPMLSWKKVVMTWLVTWQQFKFK
jgi:hypothetical protein